MHLIDQRFLGIIILCLLGALVAVKVRATGSILEKPAGGAFPQLVNYFNLFFLLVVNPCAGISWVARSLEQIDPTHIVIIDQGILLSVEALGLVLYLIGLALMAWALIILGRNYQLGGTAPRPQDHLVMVGPYRFIRHPMYTAALSIALGLACLSQSGAFLAVFCIYLVLISVLIPREEEALRQAYLNEYRLYQNQSRTLVPFIY